MFARNAKTVFAQIARNWLRCSILRVERWFNQGKREGEMLVTVVDKAGRFRKEELPANTVIRAAIKELLLSHDGWYRHQFPNLPPSVDIAAKNARRVYSALVKGTEIPSLTLEEEFLEP